MDKMINYKMSIHISKIMNYLSSQQNIFIKPQFDLKIKCVYINMSEKLRICNICLAGKQINEFDKKKYTCKICNSLKYKQGKIEERKLYRDALKMKCLADGVTEEGFNKHFIPFEKFEIMKNLPGLYSFHQCKEITKLDKQKNKPDYDNEYFLDVAFIEDKTSYYIIHII